MPILALEEHFTTAEIQKTLQPLMPQTPGGKALGEKLRDLGSGRIAAMDEGSVDLQVLSLSSAGFEKISSDLATGFARGANDQLAEAIRQHPDRFAGFASVDLQDPSGAAKEIERCMQQLHFRGAMLHGHNGGAFLDDPRFLPIWEAAAALEAPVYLHPAPPPKAVFDTYYRGLPGDCGQALSIAGWGWHVELGLHVLRLILSGLFDRFPAQQVIIGHMGEDLPFSLVRAATVLGPTAKHLKRPITDYFHDNIHVTSSGYFSQPPFLCALQVVGIDRLMYSVDYPFSANTTGKAFLDGMSLFAVGQGEVYGRQCAASAQAAGRLRLSAWAGRHAAAGRRNCCRLRSGRCRARVGNYASSRRKWTWAGDRAGW